MNWLWLNIPFMAMFFLAMTGISRSLVFKHPHRRPVLEAAPARIAPRPTVTLRAQGGEEFAVPSLVHAGR